MGIFNKIKGILFEEIEEDEVAREPKREAKPIAEKIEPVRVVEPEVKEAPRVVSTPKETVKPTSGVKKEDSIDHINERELFKSENTFNFPDFDEEEFTSLSRVQKTKQPTNVLEYEKKKKTEKKYDLGRYERIERTEVVEKKKFKPSPIISPVYGILNEDYKPEDIKSKPVEEDVDALDYASVRKKAFEEVEPVTTYYEESTIVKIKDDEEERRQKVKTIDELLEDTSDIVIKTDEVSEEVPEVETYEKIDEELDDLELHAEEKMPEYEEKTPDYEEDTLENDLFDLIDSMYDNREDGDI